MPERLALADPGVGHSARLFTHAPKEGRALGDADGAARVQHIEEVTLLQQVIIGGHDGAGRQRARAFAFPGVEDLVQLLHVADFEVVAAMLDLALQEDIAVAQAAQPVDVPHAVHILQRQHDALDAIGDFHRHRLQLQAAGLLKIGELGDFLAVEPDLPAQTPGAQGRTLPVVFHKADVLLFRLQPQRPQGVEVELLRVAGVRLQDDLILEEGLHAVGVFAVAPVIGADAGLDVGHAPGLRPQHAQQGGGVVGARADLHVVGIPQDAVLLRPEAVQPENHFLKIWGHAHP